MKNLRVWLRDHRWVLLYGDLMSLLLLGLLTYKLGNLANGLSTSEVAVANLPRGLHGLYHRPLFLPLEVLRAVVFHIFPHFGSILTRLPNAIFGLISISAFAITLRFWYGSRMAVLGTLLFATSAWTLHVSRLASFDVMYLWAMCWLLLLLAVLPRYANRPNVMYGAALSVGALLYVPGVIWLLLVGGYAQRKALLVGYRHLAAWWQKTLYGLCFLVWLPLLIVHLLRPGQALDWLGLPNQLPSLHHLGKQFGAVFVHLFIRGPAYPQVWLGRAPLLDIFSLAMAFLGICFYVRYFKATRSRVLASLFAVSVVLVTLGSPISFSLLVPLLFIAIVAGLAYLLQEWLKVFPDNPVARGLGISLLCLAVVLSSVYNVRAYFTAWPNNTVTQAIFRYHR